MANPAVVFHEISSLYPLYWNSRKRIIITVLLFKIVLGAEVNI